MILTIGIIGLILSFSVTGTYAAYGVEVGDTFTYSINKASGEFNYKTNTSTTSKTVEGYQLGDDVIPVGSSVTANKELRIQQVQQAQDMLMNIPPDVGQQNKTPFTIDLYEVIKMGLDTLEISNVEELVPKLEQEMNPIPGMEGMPQSQPPIPGPTQDQLIQAMQGGGVPPLPVPIQGAM